MDQVTLFVNKYFAIFVLAAAGAAFILPGVFIGITAYITLLLGIIMFGMGMTLRGADFGIIAKKPFPVIVGVIAQFVIMPTAAFVIALAMQLPPEIAAGLVLVGASPGGTASNVMVYLAKGDVALSVAMTSVSTILAVIMTPLLLLLFANTWLPVDAGGMLLSIVQVILIPITLGIAARKLLPNVVEKGTKVLPIISMAAIVAIVAGVLAANRENVIETGALVIAAVILHNGFGLFLGYTAAMFMGLNQAQRRAVSLEVGMQNSALASQLATVHFTPLAALPAAVFSVWHNISGPLLVSWWGRKNRP